MRAGLGVLAEAYMSTIKRHRIASASCEWFTAWKTVICCVHRYGQWCSDLLHIPLGAFKISSGPVRQIREVFSSFTRSRFRQTRMPQRTDRSSFRELQFLWKFGRARKLWQNFEISKTAKWSLLFFWGLIATTPTTPGTAILYLRTYVVNKLFQRLLKYSYRSFESCTSTEAGFGFASDNDLKATHTGWSTPLGWLENQAKSFARKRGISVRPGSIIYPERAYVQTNPRVPSKILIILLIFVSQNSIALFSRFRFAADWAFINLFARKSVLGGQIGFPAPKSCFSTH